MNFIITNKSSSFELRNISPLLEELRAEAESKFGLTKGAYTMSYMDIDNDPIAVEDDDDLAVCILEFSEMSKIDDPVTLLIESKDKNIPRRRDTPKGSGKSSPRPESPLMKKSAPAEFFLVKGSDADKNSIQLDSMSDANFDETASQLSEKVISIVDSKINENIDKKLESMLEGAIAKKIEAKLEAQMQAKQEAAQLKRDAAVKAKQLAKKKLKAQKEKKQKEKKDMIAKKLEEKKLKQEEKRKIVAAEKAEQDAKDSQSLKDLEIFQAKQSSLKAEAEAKSLKDLQTSQLKALEDVLAGDEKVDSKKDDIKSMRKLRENKQKANIIAQLQGNTEPEIAVCTNELVTDIKVEEKIPSLPVKKQAAPKKAPAKKPVAPKKESVEKKKSVEKIPEKKVDPAKPAEKKVDPAKPAEKKVIHHGIFCDGCNLGPISGTRFKCFQCPDYDLCEKCEPNHHPEHLMLRVKKPENLRAAMSNGFGHLEMDMGVKLPEQEIPQVPEEPARENCPMMGPFSGWGNCGGFNPPSSLHPMQMGFGPFGGCSNDQTSNPFSKMGEAFKKMMGMDCGRYQETTSSTETKTETETKPETTPEQPETEIFEERENLISEEPKISAGLKLSMDDSKVFEEVIEEKPEIPEPKAETSVITNLLDKLTTLSSAGDKEAFRNLAKDTWKDKSNKHAVLQELKSNPCKFGEIISGVAKIAGNAKCFKEHEAPAYPQADQMEKVVPEEDDATTMRINNMVEMFPNFDKIWVANIVRNNSALSLEALVDLILVNSN